MHKFERETSILFCYDQNNNNNIIVSAVLDFFFVLYLQRGFTPLHVASKYGNLKVVQSLIQRGTNPNFEGKNSLTPLHVATHYNRVNVALYLLDKNASPHCATKVCRLISNQLCFGVKIILQSI